jgi:short-subunit dehydrogenase
MMTERSRYYTLITGASKGIGRALAIECAKKGMNLALISLPDENLEELSNELIEKYKIKSSYKTINLTDNNAPEIIYNWCIENKLKVNTLINNAGFGCVGRFENQSAGFYMQMIDLNVNSVVLLTRLFLPDLKENSPSYILNLGSIASFYPIPYKTAYSATKIFVYSFSRALREELRLFNINVSILCPGPVITNSDVITRIHQQGQIGKWSALPPKRVAAIAIKKMLRKKFIIIPGFLSKVSFYAEKIVPMFIKQKLAARIFIKSSR